MELESTFKYKEALQVAAETVEDCQIYKSRSIPLDCDDLFSSLEVSF